MYIHIHVHYIHLSIPMIPYENPLSRSEVPYGARGQRDLPASWRAVGRWLGALLRRNENGEIVG